MKHIKIGIITLLCLIFLVGCDIDKSNNNERLEIKEELEIKTIDCIVDKCDYHYWYASGSHFLCEIDIYSIEYSENEHFTIQGLDARNFENTKKGDIVKAELYIFKDGNTGNIIKKRINKIIY